MRVLMISKACLIGPYQRKLEEIARFPDIELMVVTPPMWREHKRIIRLERMYTTGYQLIAEPMLFNGNYHLHWYPFLGRRMRRYAPDVVHIDEEPYNLSTFLALSLARRIGARSLWFTWQNLNRRYPLPFRWIEQYNFATPIMLLSAVKGQPRYGAPRATMAHWRSFPNSAWIHISFPRIPPWARAILTAILS